MESTARQDPPSERICFHAPGGAELVGILHHPRQPGTTGVVLCHGMLSTKDGEKHLASAQALAARGHLVLRFDFSGRGESQGDLMGMTFTRELGEALQAVAELRRRGARRVALAGSSMGGAVSILAAARSSIAGLVTLAAVGRADLLPERVGGPKALALWQRRGFLRFEGQPVGWALVEDARRTDLLAAAASVKCPWLILHGGRDEVVPPSDAQELQQASGGSARLEILPEADHQFTHPEHRAEAVERLVVFLDEALRT
jgi:pimeloyl-ACP methyl ester carboxylesterase